MEIYKIGDREIKKVNHYDISEDNKVKYWMILSPDELCSMNDIFNLHPSTIKECISSKQYPRIEVYDEMIFGVLNIINIIEDSFLAKELNFYLSSNYLIFVCKEKYKLLDTICTEIFDGVKSSKNYVLSLSKILYITLERLIINDNTILNKIENKISRFEEEIMSGSSKDFTKDIIRLKKELLYLKRYYEPFLDIVENLEENENGLIEEEALKFYTILKNRVQRLNNSVVNLRDYITQVREAYQAQVDINLNKIMKFFTVITTIFLPLTLIAGWYGMNFRHMPELDWIYGYPFVFVLSGIVVGISIYFFKKQKLL